MLCLSNVPSWEVLQNSERLVVMDVLNQQIGKVQARYTMWEPGVSFNVEKETLQMLGGDALFSPPTSPAAAQKTKKARGPFDSVVAFALKSSRHSI